METPGTRDILLTTLSRIQRVKVVVTGGRNRGLQIGLHEGPLVVGSDPLCDIPLEDDTVSRRHCELSLEARGVRIRDLGSTNGLLVDGLRVVDGFLGPGAKIRVGETTLTLKADGEDEVPLSPSDRFGRLFGQSEPMRALFARLGPMAASDAPLLIEGETGTGKDVTAEAVHQASPRKDGPFVLFDCGAVAATLLEAELFGYEKGAFTGATQDRAGLAEAAHGGTLVLDEVGELPLELQPKLLRLAERREVRRVGSNRPRAVDVRIISCTHRALRAEVKADRFREDLYHRLSALHVRIPALRERSEDIPGLVDDLLKQQASPRRFSDLPLAEQELLRAHRWPGNLRELRNVVDRLLVFPDEPTHRLLEREHTGTSSNASNEVPPLPVARERANEEFERRYLQLVLARAKGSVSEAAQLAGVSRQLIQRLAKRHGLK